MSSPWIVTTRRKVHLRGGQCAGRIAFPSSWLPSVTRVGDHACQICLSGCLPGPLEETAVRERMATDPREALATDAGVSS